MDISFDSKKLETEVNDSRLLRRRHGERRATLLRRRLDELHAADTLSDMMSLPQARCHELLGDMKGLLSVDLDHPYRLIFSPLDSPPPKKPDGGLDWRGVKAILILGIENTHG